MSFGHKSSGPSVNWSFGAFKPVVNGDMAMDAFRAANTFRNALVELERKRRERYHAIMAGAFPAAEFDAKIEAAAKRLSDARAAIAEKKKSSGSARVQRSDREAAKAPQIEIRELRTRRKAAEAAARARPEVAAALKLATDQHNQAVKEAQQNSGLHWGTSNAIRLGGVSQSGPPPKFHGFTGEGKLTVQLQHGADPDQVFGDGHGQLRIDRRTGLAHAEMRIGRETRDGKTTPIMVRLPVKMHRAIPHDASIRFAAVTRRRVGANEKWGLQITMSRPKGWAKPDVAFDGSCAVEVGWRLLDRGLRVAVWRGHDGETGELLIGHDQIARWREADECRSQRDRDFNEIRARLVAWIAANESSRPKWPEWFAGEIKFIEIWKSPKRIAFVLNGYAKAPFPVFSGMAAVLRGWMEIDRTRWTHEAVEREHAINWRNNAYRNFAATIRRKYQTVMVEDCEWKGLQELPAIEEPQPAQEPRYYQRIAAVATLIGYLKETVSKFLKKDARSTTIIHHACGRPTGQKNKQALMHRCEKCSAEQGRDVTFDQDQNAAENLLDRTWPLSAK